MPRGNPDNLNPVRTKEEARERGRRGGIASGKARRKKASFFQCAKMLMESTPPKELREKIAKSLDGDVDDEYMTFALAACMSMVSQAINGNTQAFRELKDTIRIAEGSIPIDSEIEDDPLSATLESFAKDELDS